MIVTPASILYGGLGLLGIATGIALLVVALRGLLRGDGSSASAQSSLVAGLVIGQTVLAIRLFSWPCLYWVLKSWVPVTPGAMCIFGVTRSAPHLTGWLQVLEPATLLVAGAMFLVLGAYRAGGQWVTARTVLGHLAVGGALGAATSFLAILLLCVPKGAQEVSCCSVIFDQPTRLSAAVGSFILGARSGEWLLALTQSIALAYLALQLWMRVSLAGPSWRKIVVVALALVHVAMVGVLMFEVISPVLTERPLHHCPYCLTKPHYHNTLATLAGLLLLGLATFIPLWLVWLGVVATPPTAVLQWWQTVSALGLVLFWSLVLVPYYYKLR